MCVCVCVCVCVINIYSNRNNGGDYNSRNVIKERKTQYI